MRASEKSLLQQDVEVGAKFAASDEWEKLLDDPIARDLFIAIGQSHLRGPDFFEDCFRFSEFVRDREPCRHCGKLPALETAGDLLDALRRACHDPAIRDPWKPLSRFGTHWSKPSTDELIRADELDRELRLRELLAMVRAGIHEIELKEAGGDPLREFEPHMKWHYAPPPPEPEPILFFEI